MRSLTLLSVFVLAASVAIAQPDQLSAKNSDITIQPILHGTLVLSWNDLTIYVDPYGGGEVFDGQKKPDLVLITDIHGDHHNQGTLDALDLSSAVIIAPQAVADKMQTDNIEVLTNGSNIDIKGINVAAIPMYNLTEGRLDKHVKGRGNGYVLTIDGKRIYISGDTEDIPEMRALTDIDVAFVCMNLPYTMDINQAADAVSEFQPKIVYPYHYRGPDGLSDVDSFKSLVNEKAPSVEVRLHNWYPGN